MLCSVGVPIIKRVIVEALCVFQKICKKRSVTDRLTDCEEGRKSSFSLAQEETALKGDLSTSVNTNGLSNRLIILCMLWA